MHEDDSLQQKKSVEARGKNNFKIQSTDNKKNRNILPCHTRPEGHITGLII